MKRVGIIAAALAIVLVPVLVFFAGAVHAQSFRSGDNITVGAGETVDSSLWASGRHLDIAGTVNGDIWCAGMTVTITGTVNGDVLCAAQTVRISGEVTGDVRVAAQTVNMGNAVGGNVSVVAQSFSLGGDAAVAGDASVVSSDITLNGEIGRDAALTSDTIAIAGEVGRDITATVSNLTLSDQAVVGGDIAYTSNNDATIASGAQVQGETTRSVPPAERDGVRYMFGFGLMAAFFIILSLLLLALVLLVLFPGMFRSVTDTALVSPLKVLLVGFLAGLVFPVAFFTLLVTLVGIPLAFLLLLAWLLIVVLAGPFFAYYLGRLLTKDRQHPALIMTLGSLIVLLAYFIPFIGFIVMLIVLWMGIGMVLVTLYNRKWHPGTTPVAAAASGEPMAKPKKRDM